MTLFSISPIDDTRCHLFYDGHLVGLVELADIKAHAYDLIEAHVRVRPVTTMQDGRVDNFSIVSSGQEMQLQHDQVELVERLHRIGKDTPDGEVVRCAFVADRSLEGSGPFERCDEQATETRQLHGFAWPACDHHHRDGGFLYGSDYGRRVEAVVS